MNQAMKTYANCSRMASWMSILILRQECLAYPMNPLILTRSDIQLNEQALVLLLVLRDLGWLIRWCWEEPSPQTATTGQRQNVTISSTSGSKLVLEFAGTWIGAERRLDVKVGSLIVGAEGDTSPVSGAGLSGYERKLAASLTAIKSKQERKGG